MEQYCHCKTADRSVRGGQPLMPADFTSDAVVHVSYSNWDEIHLFTCEICKKSWLLVNQYVDRPPYIGKAYGLGPVGLSDLQKRVGLIKKKGPEALPSIYK